MSCVLQFQLLYMNKDPRKPRLRRQLQMTFYSTTGNIPTRCSSDLQLLPVSDVCLSVCCWNCVYFSFRSVHAVQLVVLGLPSHTSTSAESCNPLVHNVPTLPASQPTRTSKLHSLPCLHTSTTLAGYVRPPAPDFLHPGYQRIEAFL